MNCRAIFLSQSLDVRVVDGSAKPRDLKMADLSRSTSNSSSILIFPSPSIEFALEANHEYDDLLESFSDQDSTLPKDHNFASRTRKSKVKLQVLLHVREP